MIGKTAGIEKIVKCAEPINEAYLIATVGGSNDTFAVANGDSSMPMGVFQHTTNAAGEDVRIMISGVTPVVYGATISRGQLLKSDANGRAVPVTTVGDHVLGRATVSGNAGDIGYCIISLGRY